MFEIIKRYLFLVYFSVLAFSLSSFTVVIKINFTKSLKLLSNYKTGYLTIFIRLYIRNYIEQ